MYEIMTSSTLALEEPVARPTAHSGRTKRPPRLNRHRFSTSEALVTITFPEREATREDLLQALSEVERRVNST